MDNLYIALWQFANGFLRFALVMIIGVLILKIVFIPIKRMLMKSKVDHTAKTFLFSLIRVILYGIVVITALGTAGVDISSLITALGAAALTAGLAFQDTLLDESKGEEALQFIDLESWTRRYLIDEIFENYDGGCHSQYFFRDQRDGKDNRIIAGPCWDYDNCADGWFMAKQNPRCFLMQRMWKNEGEHTPWYGTLMKKETFRDRVLELYRNELSAKVRHLMEVQLPEEAAFLQKALKMNAIRWSLADPAEAIQHFHDCLD